jgi:hypothetical protein
MLLGPKSTVKSRGLPVEKTKFSKILRSREQAAGGISAACEPMENTEQVHATPEQIVRATASLRAALDFIDRRVPKEVREANAAGIERARACLSIPLDKFVAPEAIRGTRICPGFGRHPYFGKLPWP